MPRTYTSPGPLAIYLAQIDITPLLTRAEERIVARQIRNGLTAEARLNAREHLITANLRLVVSIARLFTRKGLSLDDLVGYGNAGLCIAADRFDHRCGTKFSTYATWWIKHQIKRALRQENNGQLRVPCYLVTILNHWHRTAHRLASELHRPPLFDEIADAEGLKRGQRKQIRKALAANAMVRHEESSDYGTRLEDVLADHQADGSTESISHADQMKALMDHVKALMERRGLKGSAAFAVLLGHCGFDGDTKTLEGLSQEYGLTKERVRQLESQAIRAIRWELAGCGIG